MALFKRDENSGINEHLITGERVLAWAVHSGGKIYVTNHALLSFDQHERLRLPWDISVSGKWDEPILTVTTQVDHLNQPTERAWQLIEPGFVPEAVRERITYSQVFDQTRNISDIGKVRFIARRSPNGINWTTLTDFPVDEVSQTHIQNELASLRLTLGI